MQSRKTWVPEFRLTDVTPSLAVFRKSAPLRKMSTVGVVAPDQLKVTVAGDVEVSTLALSEIGGGGSGERISVSFPQNGLTAPWAACGRVIRCEEAALGYRVAVEFESMPNAA